jgi:hypothetical protein
VLLHYAPSTETWLLKYIEVFADQKLIIDMMRKYSLQIDGSSIIENLQNLDVSWKGMMVGFLLAMCW